MRARSLQAQVQAPAFQAKAAFESNGKMFLAAALPCLAIPAHEGCADESHVALNLA